MTYLRNEYEISERRACQAMQMNRSSCRYVGGQELMDEAYRRVVSLSQQYPYRGYRKIYDRPGQSVAERVQREFQFDFSHHLPGSMAILFDDGSSGDDPSLARRIQHGQAAWVARRHEPGTISTAMDRSE